MNFLFSIWWLDDNIHVKYTRIYIQLQNIKPETPKNIAIWLSFSSPLMIAYSSARIVMYEPLAAQSGTSKNLLIKIHIFLIMLTVGDLGYFKHFYMI